MTEILPPRTEYYYCRECQSRYTSQSAARHCEDRCAAGED